MKKKVFILVFLVILVISAFNYYNNMKKISSLKQDIDRLNDQIQVNLDKQENLKKQLANLDNEEFIEKVARTKLGLVKPGEVLVVPVEDKKDK